MFTIALLTSLVVPADSIELETPELAPPLDLMEGSGKFRVMAGSPTLRNQSRVSSKESGRVRWGGLPPLRLVGGGAVFLRGRVLRVRFPREPPLALMPGSRGAKESDELGGILLI